MTIELRFGEKNLTHYYDNSSYANRKKSKCSKNTYHPMTDNSQPSVTENKARQKKRKHKNANKNLDHTTIVKRFRTVSWSNDSHPTVVVKPLFLFLYLRDSNPSH